MFANLPPGDYLMTAVTDMEQDEQFDPAFLDLMSRSAIVVAIAEGEKKAQESAAQSSAAVIHHEGTRCVAMNQ